MEGEGETPSHPSKPKNELAEDPRLTTAGETPALPSEPRSRQLKTENREPGTEN